ncbi:MAG: PQQ-binding-like beta-propeller repeat protein [Ktedonobacteraceae bacterium]
MRCNSLRNPWDINDGSYAEAYNAATGTKVWSRSILPWYAMVIVNGVVYVQSGLGYPNGQSSVYALNAQTGQTIWNVVLQQNLSSASPAVANGVSLLKNCDMM